MIRKESLRIGNLILYKPYGNRDGEIKTIRGMLDMNAYFDRHSNESGMFHNLEGIPLSEDWLKKCGFTFHKSVGSEYLAYNGLRLSLTFYRWIPGDNYLQLDSPFGSTEIRFVHELMNYFFVLCGQELKIEL